MAAPTPRLSQRQSAASRPTEPIVLAHPPNPAPLPRPQRAPTEARVQTPEVFSQPAKSARPQTAARELRQQLQSEPTQMLELGAFKTDETMVGLGPNAESFAREPGPQKSATAPPLAPPAPAGPAFANESDPPKRALSLGRLFAKSAEAADMPEPATAETTAASAPWARKALAFCIDALVPIATGSLWVAMEAFWLGLDWPLTNNDLLWTLAQWAHLHFGVGLRGVILACTMAWAHQIAGAHSGRTLGQSLSGIRLIRNNKRPHLWPWAIGYASISFLATVFCGANLYFMVVDKKQRSFSQSLFDTSLIVDAQGLTASFRLDAL